MKLALPVLLLVPLSSSCQTPIFSPRPANAPVGTEFVHHVTSLDFTNREREIYEQITAGNVPEFFRKFSPVTVTNIAEGKTNVATFFAAPDYLAVGSDADYFLTPMTPMTAQRIADRLGCTLPTRKMTDDIYAAAAVKLVPSPMTPGARMITVPQFAEHNAIVRTQRVAELAAHPLGALVAGDKKDIVITARLTNSPGKVAIYGWHKANGAAIQPLYLGHTSVWADYSHGVRLVQQKMFVNGNATTVAEVLANPKLSGLLSDEGVVTTSRYETNAIPALSAAMRDILRPGNATDGTNGTAGLSAFKATGSFGERTLSFVFEPEVKIHINAPVAEKFSPDKPVLLVFYALPNGNTTEQTIGHKLQPGEDWHFDIQHIGAQTRWLRERMADRTVVVAYLEAGMKSWPTWRKTHGDDKIPGVFAVVKKIFGAYRVETVLASHSGGGSLMFGYLNTQEKIPSDVTRIAFLDSNYAYSTTNHLAKLSNWLKASDEHKLCVLAYDDANALLDGKAFVTEAGGTWGRSHVMLKDLGEQFMFTSRTNTGLETYFALDGRLQLLLKQNPERKIFHTVQVERNGFIHTMLMGTPREGKGYQYFGERAFGEWIQSP
ncbi:MAG: hypothetical protein EXS35_14140 [Pedosphaera sp.]|nr:hypothetical protein [Pedosphaera sp.]